MAITLEQIAKLAGVSLSTASRVLNRHPGVKPETRERVLRFIREYRYQPDPVARSLAAQRPRKNRNSSNNKLRRKGGRTKHFSTIFYVRSTQSTKLHAKIP